ncbi:helix-turn-helix domain-containing protein, partial [Spirosoma arcticum]
LITLQEGAKYHPKPEFREKCRALLLNQAGVTIKQIATHLVVNHNTVGSWIKIWQTVGLVGLSRKAGQGRTPILSVSNATHTQYLDKAVEAHAQNVKAIQAELIKELATPVSSDTVKRFLKKIIIHGDVSAGVRIKAKTK